MEPLAQLEDRGHALRHPLCGRLHAQQAPAQHARRAVRARGVQAVRRRPQPVRVRRLLRQGLGLPLLLLAQPLPGALPGHQRAVRARRALPAVHDDRVHPEPGGAAAPARVPLRRRHVRRGRRARGRQGERHAGAADDAGVLPRRAGHVRHARARARARLRRVLQVLRVPRRQGVQHSAGHRAAGAARRRRRRGRAAGRAGRAAGRGRRRGGRRRGRQRRRAAAVCAAAVGPGVRHDDQQHLIRPAARRLPRRLDAAPRTLHRHRARRRRGAARRDRAAGQLHGARDALRRRPLDRGPGARYRARAVRGDPVAQGPRKGLGAALPQGEEVLRRLGARDGRARPRHGHLHVRARPGER